MNFGLNLKALQKPTSVAMSKSPMVASMSNNDVTAMMGGVQMAKNQPEQDTVSFSGCCGN